MAVTEQELENLVAYCEENLGDKTLWRTPAGYPDSLALCVIDSLYSTGSHYTSVVNVINRYRDVRGGHDGAKGLLESIAEAGGADAWAVSVTANVKPAHTRKDAPLKAEVIHRAAQMLTDLGIDTVDDFRRAAGPDPRASPVHAGWKKLPSQSSGVTFNYLLILAGLPSVKPDRMVLRFLADALGENVELSNDRAVELISAAASKLQVDPRALDHVVWRAASGRSLVD